MNQAGVLKPYQTLSDLGKRLPYEEASLLAKRFGLELSRTQMNQLTSDYAQACKTRVQTQLKSNREASSSYTKEASGRTLVLEMDGVYVLGQAQEGACAGLEIKTAVLYLLNSPSQRWMLADRCSSESFLEQLSGLLKQAKLTPKDTLIGLANGATWIDKIFDYLQAKRITDVCHATEYLDTIMQAMN